MNVTDYVARVIAYYAQRKPKVGTLAINEKTCRLCIHDAKGRTVSTYPGDGLHCGDNYILKDHDGTWRITQCELVDGIWCMLGSSVTDENVGVEVLYVPHQCLWRVINEWINPDWKLDALSPELIQTLLREN
jgi:hypothetical protein